jgi:hypothetical protein
VKFSILKGSISIRIAFTFYDKRMKKWKIREFTKKKQKRLFAPPSLKEKTSKNILEQIQRIQLSNA